jgi:hypothetical protein
VDRKVEKAENSLWGCRKANGGTLGLGPKVVHWLYVCHQAICHLCIHSMVAWLSDGQSQKTKQTSKNSMLRDDRNDAYYSQQCHGGTNLPTPLEIVVQGGAMPTAHRL